MNGGNGLLLHETESTEIKTQLEFQCFINRFSFLDDLLLCWSMIAWKVVIKQRKKEKENQKFKNKFLFLTKTAI